MVDLNQVFSSGTLSSDVLRGASAASFNQQDDSTSYPSFTEALASAQAASSQSQDETLAGATMVPQFQTAQTSWHVPTFDSQSNFGSADTPIAKPTVEHTSSSSTDVSKTSKEDHYISSGSKQHPAAATNQATATQATSAKPETEKSKHRKENLQTSSAAPDESDSTAANGSAEENATPAVAVVTDPTALNSEQPASQSSQDGPTAAASTRKTKAGDAAGDLAFAVKVQGTNASTDPSLPTARTPANPLDVSGQAPASQFAAQLNTLMASAPQKILTNASPSAKDGSISGLTLVPAGAPQGGSGASTETIAEAPAEEVSKTVEVVDDKTASAQPLKSVQVQITGTDNQRIDLRLMEKAGSLTMSVRSADGSLTKALQQHLPELATTLNDQQIRAEWWKPDVQKAESAKSTDDSGSKDLATQDQSNQNKGNSGQQGGRSTRQTDWIEELSDLHKSSQNGAQYTWHL